MNSDRQMTAPSKSIATVGIIAIGFPPATLAGGPVRSIYALSKQLARVYRVYVLTTSHDLGQRAPLPVETDTWIDREGVFVYFSSPRKLRLAWRSLDALRQVRPDVVYINSFFNAMHSILPQVVHRFRWWGRSGLILAPRGELSSAALQLNSVRKRAYLMVYKMTGQHRRVVWHASSEREKIDIQREFPTALNIIVRENETVLPSEALVATPVHQPVRIVFVSRIVPIKGLDVLLRCLPDLSSAIDLEIYGAAEDAAYASMCQSLVADVSEQTRVSFRGPAPAQEVRRVFNRSDLFVFPTQGENFGHVIAEALSASCPVFASANTPWTPVLEAGGGAALRSLSPRAWSARLNEYLMQADSVKFQMKQSAGEEYARWRRANVGPSVVDIYAGLGASSRRLQ